MRVKKLSDSLGRAIVVGAALAMAMMPLQTVYASSSNGKSGHFNRGVSVFDDFNNLYLRPDDKAYWYIEQMGTLANGSEGVAREVECALQTCVKSMHEDGEKFVRLEVHPHVLTNNQYTNANLSEDFDGADGDPVYGGQSYPGAYNPTVGHPIVVESRIKFSSNYKDDGSGGATGTAGILLWNNPFSQQAPFGGYSIYSELGFNWASNQSVFIDGLSAAFAKDGFPISFQDVAVSNMSDWNVYKFVWSTDAEGNQGVDYFVNGTQVASTFIPSYLGLHNLGLEVWNDNQVFTFSGINKVSIPENQYIDLDYVDIYQM